MGGWSPVGWTGAALDGVLRRSAPVHADARGAFSEIWRASLTDPLGGETFVQANLSRSQAGVLRGMHFHRRQVDLWTVIEGRALVALADLRALVEGPGGAGGPEVVGRLGGAGVDGVVGRPAVETFELAPGDAVYIPRLVAHGFYALESMAMIYLVSNEYDGSDEQGFAWNDPAAAIPWPDVEPILSDRDRSNPPLAEALR